MAKDKKKSHIPKEHWELRYNMHEASPDIKAIQGQVFNPMKPGKRPTPPLRVNETDY